MGVCVPPNVGVFVIDEVVEVDHLFLVVANEIFVCGIIVVDARLAFLVPSGEKELAGDADFVFVGSGHLVGCWFGFLVEISLNNNRLKLSTINFDYF